MKSFLWLIIILLVGSKIYSQPFYFNNRYDLNVIGSWDGVDNLVEVEDGYIISGGTGHELNPNAHVIAFMKIDKSGNKIWTKIYGDTSVWLYNGTSGSLITLKNSYYAFGGSKLYLGDTIKNVAAICKLNSNWDTLWMKEYGNLDNVIDTVNIGKQVKQCESGDLILVGSEYYYGDIEKQLLIRTDSLGNKIWKRTYGTSGSNQGFSVIQTSDGGFTIGGFRYTWGQSITGDAIVIKTDSLGNQKWIKNIGGPVKDHIARVCLSKDGYILAATTRGDSMSGNYDFYGRIKIVKMGNDGTIIWEKLYGKSKYKNYVSNIRCLSDGSIITVGSVPTDYPHRSGWVLKTTSDGDSLWYREYDNLLGEDSENRLYEIIPTSDKGFLACGMVFPFLPDTGTQDAWVIKLDSIGCDTPGCDTTVAIPEIAYKKMHDDLYIYPNPASNVLNIQYPITNDECRSIISIYDIFGRKEKEIKVPKGQQQLSVDVSNWHNGLYVAVLKNNKKFITKQKFMVLR